MSMVRKGEADVAKFDKQIADLEQKALKVLSPFREKINTLKEQRTGLIEYLEKFKSFTPDEESTSPTSPISPSFPDSPISPDSPSSPINPLTL